MHFQATIPQSGDFHNVLSISKAWYSDLISSFMWTYPLVCFNVVRIYRVSHWYVAIVCEDVAHPY